MKRTYNRLASLALALLMVTSVVSVAQVGSAATTDSTTFAVTQGGECYEIAPLGDSSQNVTSFYDYRSHETSPNGTYSSYGAQDLQESQVSNLFVYNGSNGFSLVMLHDRLNESESPVSPRTITFDLTNMSDGEWAVQDDTYGDDNQDDNWNINGSEQQVVWKWHDTRTDGGAFRGFGSNEIAIEPGFNENSTAWGEDKWVNSSESSQDNRITEWQLLSDGDDVTSQSLNFGQEVKIQKGTCETPDETAPTANLTASPTSADVNETAVQFDASDSSDDSGIAEFRWDFDGDDSVDANTTNATTTHTYAKTGTFNATVTVVDGNGSTDTATATVTVSDNAPTVRADVPDAVTVNETFEVDGSNSSDNSGIASYEWTFSDETNASGESVTHSYNETGTYNVTLTVTDGAGNNDTVTTEIEVTEPDETPPNASVSADPTDAAIDEMVTFDASNSSDNREISEFRWDFDGDGNVDNTTTSATTTHTYAETGSFDATVTVIDTSDNTANATATITVNDTSSPTARADVPGAVEVNATFTANGSASTDNGEITGYEWQFENGPTKSGATVTHNYSETGTYNVTLTVTDGANHTDTDTVEVTVTEPDETPPNASVSVDPTDPAVGSQVTFDASNSTDDSGIAEFRWDFDGNGNVDATTSDAVTTHTYSTAGEYNATVTVVDAGSNKDTATKTIEVTKKTDTNDPPTAKFDPIPETVKVNERVWLDANDSSDSDGVVELYKWEFGDGNNKTAGKDNHKIPYNYSEAGNYTVTLTVHDDDDATDTVSRTVHVVDKEDPTAVIDLPNKVHVGETFTADGSQSTDNGQINLKTWSFEDGPQDQEGITVDHTYHQTGTYTVTLVVEDTAGNTDKKTQDIQVVARDDSDDGDNGNGDGNGDNGDNGGDDDDTGQNEPDGGGAPPSDEPAMNVGVERPTTDRVTVSVTDADVRDQFTFDLPSANDSAVTYGEAAIRLAVSGNFDLSARATADAPDEVRAPTAANDGFEPVSYLNVSSSDLSDADIANATFTFAVDKQRLDELGVAPGDVAAYRFDDGSWNAVETEQINETADAYEFRATSRGVGVFAVGANQSSPDVSDIALSRATITAGESVEVTATLENVGKADGTLTATLSLSDDQLTSQSIGIPAGESKAVTFVRQFDEPGTYTVSVNGVTVELTVEAATTETTTSSTTTGTGQPGFGLVVSLIALAGAALVARRRR